MDASKGGDHRKTKGQKAPSFVSLVTDGILGVVAGMEEDSLATTCKIHGGKKKPCANYTLSDNFKHAANVCAQLCRQQHPLLFLGSPSPPLEEMRFPEAHLSRRGMDTEAFPKLRQRDLSFSFLF